MPNSPEVTASQRRLTSATCPCRSCLGSSTVSKSELAVLLKPSWSWDFLRRSFCRDWNHQCQVTSTDRDMLAVVVYIYSGMCVFIVCVFPGPIRGAESSHIVTNHVLCHKQCWVLRCGWGGAGWREICQVTYAQFDITAGLTVRLASPWAYNTHNLGTYWHIYRRRRERIWESHRAHFLIQLLILFSFAYNF